MRGLGKADENPRKKKSSKRVERNIRERRKYQEVREVSVVD